jgi:vanillate O-demethylase monooxygenase subunit
VGLEDPRYTLRSGYLDYQANYGLINDNLTDFSHLSYVHANSFGTNEDWARTRPAITQLPRGIRVQRWMPAGMGGMRKEDSPLAQANARTNLPPTDHWQSYDFLAPGILLMRSRMFEAGAMEKLNGAEPDEDFGPVFSDTFTSQAVTPMTDSTSRYFFSWGPKAGPGSDELAEAMLKVAHMAFGEDKIIIEAQQRVMDSTPEAKEVLTSADVGPTQMRAVINRLIAAESAGPEKAAAKRTRVPA